MIIEVFKLNSRSVKGAGDREIANANNFVIDPSWVKTVADINFDNYIGIPKLKGAVDGWFTKGVHELVALDESPSIYVRTHIFNELVSKNLIAVYN